VACGPWLRERGLVRQRSVGALAGAHTAHFFIPTSSSNDGLLATKREVEHPASPWPWSHNRVTHTHSRLRASTRACAHVAIRSARVRWVGSTGSTAYTAKMRSGWPWRAESPTCIPMRLSGHRRCGYGVSDALHRPWADTESRNVHREKSFDCVSVSGIGCGCGQAARARCADSRNRHAEQGATRPSLSNCGVSVQAMRSLPHFTVGASGSDMLPWKIRRTFTALIRTAMMFPGRAVGTRSHLIVVVDLGGRRLSIQPMKSNPLNTQLTRPVQGCLLI
jgi:hypothetical protein